MIDLEHGVLVHRFELFVATDGEARCSKDFVGPFRDGRAEVGLEAR
jgi:hypothetical protein